MYMNYIYLEMYRLIPSSDPRTGHTLREPSAAGFWERRLSLYKILFHFKASVWESIILVLPPRHLQSLPYCNTIVRLLRNIRHPPTPPFYVIRHTILVMAISCKGQTKTPQMSCVSESGSAYPQSGR